MAVNEQIVTGRAHRVLIDKVAKLWQKISFWTKSSDVEFNDGKSAETKVGAIDGITDSLASTSSRIAASAKALSTVNNKLGGFEPIIDSTGKITGYKTKVGADTVFPFSGIANAKVSGQGEDGGYEGRDFVISVPGASIIFLMVESANAPYLPTVTLSNTCADLYTEYPPDASGRMYRKLIRNSSSSAGQIQIHTNGYTHFKWCTLN